MTTELIISGIINLTVSFALSRLLAGPDIVQEGPRLTNLGISTATYGRFVDIPFGTSRVAVNVVWAQEIEERSTEDRVGGKGGQSVTQVTYSYFLSLAAAVGIEGVDDVLRIWFDGKLVYDKTGTGPVAKEGIKFTLYAGGPDQGKDPLEVADKGDANTPAYRHLSRIVFEDIPLDNYGNRPPNITAEVTFNKTVTNPFTSLTESGGINIPGSTSGSDISYMFVDLDLNRYGGLKNGSNGIWTADLTAQVVTSQNAISGLTHPAYGFGFFYKQEGSQNSTPIRKIDAITGLQVGTFGSTGTGTSDTASRRASFGNWSLTRVSAKKKFFDFLVHLSDFGSVTGSVTNATDMTHVALLDDLGVTFLGDGGQGFSIPDDSRGSGADVTYVVTGGGGNIQVVRIKYQVNIGIGGVLDVRLEAKEIASLTRGDPDDDFPSNTDPVGWAVHRPTGYLLISNEGSTVVFDPETATVIAKKQIRISSINSYIHGNSFAYTTGSGSSGTLHVIDPLTLEEKLSVAVSTIGMASPAGGHNREGQVWEPVNESLIMSRVDLGSNPATERVVRIFVDRASGGGVALDVLQQSLLTTYQNLPLGDLPSDAHDVTALSAINVRGFTINRQSTLREISDQLRGAYFYDLVESDWKLKAVLRGTASEVLTVPAADVGLLLGDNDVPVRETRTQEAELPLVLEIRFSNEDLDYDADVAMARRIKQPVSAMAAKTRSSIATAIVFDDATEPKQIAEKWLSTVWQERVQVQTVIPWTYLKLDPSDVVNLVVGSQTVRVRLGEIEVGANLSMEVNGAVERAFAFTSSVLAGLPVGFLPQDIPAATPTKVVFLDAPLLHVTDLNSDVSSAAYAAMGSFDDNWPGAGLYLAQDGVNFLPSAIVVPEMAWGIVTTVPGAWPRSANRFQEIVDGGTMGVRPIRRSAAFSSATELEVLNTANAIAVVTSAGVEVIQFQDVTVNGDNTLTLDRLLRGRLGTEDVQVTGPAVGDTFVLLHGALVTNEFLSIAKNNLPISLLNTSLLWRAPSVGTLLEDSAQLSFTYTGRDVMPYSPAHATATREMNEDVTIDWVRRTRINGEMVDGTGTVPLNETIEQYEVEVFDVDTQTVIRTFVVDDAVTVTYTDAEQNTDAVGPRTPMPLLNPGGEDDTSSNPPTDWTDITGDLQLATGPSGDGTVPRTGTYFFYAGDTALTQASQDVAVPAATEADIDAGLLFLDWNYFISAAGLDRARITIEFFDNVMASLGTSVPAYASPNGPSWTALNQTAAVPTLTRTIRYVIDQDRQQGTSNDGRIDDISTSLRTTIVNEDVVIRIRQISGTGIKGPFAELVQMPASN